MSEQKGWRAWLAEVIFLLSGIVPGYFFAMAGWFGGSQVLFWVIAFFIAFAVFSAILQFPLIWLSDRMSKPRRKTPEPAPKWNEGWKPALAFFTAGLGIGIAAFFVRRLWHSAGVA